MKHEYSIDTGSRYYTVTTLINKTDSVIIARRRIDVFKNRKGVEIWALEEYNKWVMKDPGHRIDR